MYGSPVTVANRMKSDYGTDMYTIGIGVEVDEEILQKMASPGQYVRLKHTSDLKDITEFLLNGKIGKKKKKKTNKTWSNLARHEQSYPLYTNSFLGIFG